DRYLKARLRRQVEDLSNNVFDPIGTMVSLTTEFAFRTSEVRRAIYGVGRSFDSAITRVLLIVAGIKKALSRFVWAAALFSLGLDILVRLDVLSPNPVLLRSRRLGTIEVSEITAIVLPLFVVALLLSWFGRLLRARAYSGSQSEQGSGSARQARGRR